MNQPLQMLVDGLASYFEPVSGPLGYIGAVLINIVDDETADCFTSFPYPSHRPPIELHCQP
jgi:inhibitor of KinA sporulation pathway (predicted exonuclease)